MNRRRLTLLVLLFLWPIVDVAAAPSKPVGSVTGVALMPLETKPEDQAAARQILAAVRDALDTTPGYAEKGPIEMGLDEARMSFSCFDEKPGCMAQVGALLDAKFLLWGKLAHQDETLRLELHYVDVAKGTSRDETYSESGAGAVDRLGRLASEVVVGKRAAPEALLSVRSAPSGATVTIDGASAGVTPLDVSLPVGLHSVSVDREGYQPRKRSIELVAGAPTPLILDERLEAVGGVAEVVPEAEAEAEIRDEAERPRGTRFWLGVGSAGVAAAAVASAGIFGLKALDHRDWAEKHKDDDTTDAEYANREDQLSSVKLAANVSWGVAGLAAAASAYFFITADGERDTALQLVPEVGGVSVLGRF